MTRIKPLRRDEPPEDAGMLKIVEATLDQIDRGFAQMIANLAAQSAACASTHLRASAREVVKHAAR